MGDISRWLPWVDFYGSQLQIILCSVVAPKRKLSTCHDKFGWDDWWLVDLFSYLAWVLTTVQLTNEEASYLLVSRSLHPCNQYITGKHKLGSFKSKLRENGSRSGSAVILSPSRNGFIGYDLSFSISFSAWSANLSGFVSFKIHI